MFYRYCPTSGFRKHSLLPLIFDILQLRHQCEAIETWVVSLLAATGHDRISAEPDHAIIRELARWQSRRIHGSPRVCGRPLTSYSGQAAGIAPSA